MLGRRAFNKTCLVLAIAAWSASLCWGQRETVDLPDKEKTPPEQAEMQDHSGELPKPPALPPPQGLKAMPKPNRIWVDMKRREVVIDGYISLREGMLEMFACPVGSKEHESIVAVYARPQVAHAALLAVGAKQGTPVRFQPEFQPPTGTEIEIEVRWLDKCKKWQSARAQNWVKDARTEKPMPYPWVFAGSGFWKDEATGQQHYMGDTGDFICVSNFTTATLDIPAESSQAASGLLFETFSERIPPLDTPVRLVLKPQLKKDTQAKPESKDKRSPEKQPALEPIGPK